MYVLQNICFHTGNAVTNLESDCGSRCLPSTVAVSLQVNSNAYNCSKSIEFVYARNMWDTVELFSELIPV
jgi:hypothetical protein